MEKDFDKAYADFPKCIPANASTVQGLLDLCKRQLALYTEGEPTHIQVAWQCLQVSEFIKKYDEWIK